MRDYHLKKQKKEKQKKKTQQQEKKWTLYLWGCMS